MIRARHVGPAKNPNAVRVVHEGTVTVNKRSLSIELDDGRYVRLSFDGAADMVELAADILDQLNPHIMGVDMLRAKRMVRAYINDLWVER